jgi:branched-chain amino acid transport system substrate-binding protein
LTAGHILVPDAYGQDTEAYRVATDFIERYTDRYGLAPDIFAGHAYDAIHIVVDAARRLPDDFTPSDLRDEIEQTSGFVSVGGTFTFSATDHNGMSESDLSFYRIEDGTWVLAEEAR